MEEKNEPTLAEKIENLNIKLEEIINVQINIQEEIKLKNKVLMKRIDKLQEHNEIEDMRAQILEKKINYVINKFY
jgi:hypothetical protein